MANVFGILTSIVLLLAGFVAFKNKKAYETEIANTGTEKNKLSLNEDRFQTASDSLANTIAQRTDVDTEVVSLLEAETAQKKSNDDLKNQISEKTSKAASNKEKLDDIRDKTAKVGDIRELANKMKAMNAELEQLSQTITASEANLANLTAQNNATESQASAMKKTNEIMSSGKSLPTLSTRIRSIYPTWGFVTLGTGNNGGVVTNSILDVVRGDTVVAQLMVTSVESNSSSASIIPDSIAQDVTLMVGDRVIPSQDAGKPANN